MPPIYLDYNASAPLRPEALEAMRPWLESQFGNPSSTHRLGQSARNAVEAARERLGALLHCKASELHFSSGGSESINTAIKGAKPQKRILQSAQSEHPATLESIDDLDGWEKEWLSLNARGEIQSPRFKPGLLSIMHANNETGLIHPIDSLAQAAKAQGALVHCDAVQSFGKLPIDLSKWEIDFLSASAHKFGGPQGVGFLFVREGQDLQPLIRGGEQEGGLRAGTLNVAGIVGMVRAAELAFESMEKEAKRHLLLRERLETRLLKNVPGIKVNGAGASRLPNTLSLLLPGIESELMIMRLDQEGISVSAGSACAAGALEASHVLRAMGLSEAESKCALRLSWGYRTQESELDFACDALEKGILDFERARQAN